MKDTFEEAMTMLLFVATNAAICHAYSNWRASAVKQRNDEAFMEVQSSLDDSFLKRVLELPEEKKRLLGFKDVAGQCTVCMPVWLWEILPDTTVVASSASAAPVTKKQLLRCAELRLVERDQVAIDAIEGGV